MESVTRDLKLNLGKVDQRHVRLALVVLTVILVVLGAGAPGSMGDIGS